MKQFLFLAIVVTLACCIKVSQNSAYNVLQNEISSLNSENEANQKTMSKMRSTLKQMMNEMRDLKWSNVNGMNTHANNNAHASAEQKSTTSGLSKADEERLKNIKQMAEKITQQHQRQRTTNKKAAATHSTAHSAAHSTAHSTAHSANTSTNNKTESKEMKGLQQLSEHLQTAKRLMNNKNVKREEKDTDANLKSELKRYRHILEELDTYAVQEIEKHQQKHHFPKTIEEKNLNRRKRYIALREKKTLEELNKKEMELLSTTPSFQGTMKESLLAIFKNEDKQRMNHIAAANNKSTAHNNKSNSAATASKNEQKEAEDNAVAEEETSAELE